MKRTIVSALLFFVLAIGIAGCDESSEAGDVVKKFFALAQKEKDSDAMKYVISDVVNELKNNPSGYEKAAKLFIEDLTEQRCDVEIVDDHLWQEQAKIECSVKLKDGTKKKKIIVLKREDDGTEWKITNE